MKIKLVNEVGEWPLVDNIVVPVPNKNQRKNNWRNLLINPFYAIVHLICIVGQIAGFYRKCNTVLKWVKINFYVALFFCKRHL